MPYFNIVAQTSENTVVTEYEPMKARHILFRKQVASCFAEAYCEAIAEAAEPY